MPSQNPQSEGYWKPYQLAFLADQSPRKLVNKSRRIGFSEVTVFERAARVLGLELRVDGTRLGFGGVGAPIDQNLISAGLTQAKDLLKRTMVHVNALSIALFGRTIVKRQTATLCELENGATIRVYAASPKSVRSFEGDVFLDEFASVQDDIGLWRAAEPLTKPTLGTAVGYKMVVVSTPLGDDNLFYEMAEGKYKHTFSQHKITIHQAAEQGFPILVSDGMGKQRPGTTEELRAEYSDDELFSQEFECLFISADSRYISADVYNAACYDSAYTPPELERIGVPNFGGLDLARSRDRTAFVRLAYAGDVCWHRYTDTIKDRSWEQQEEWWDGHMTGCSRVAVDATAIGSAPAERMQRRWGAMIEPVDFTTTSKEHLASSLRLALQRKVLRPRSDDVELRREVLSMRRIATETGVYRYHVPREAGGHGDRAWALALAHHASGAPVAEYKPQATTRASLEQHRPRPTLTVKRSQRRGIWRS